MDKYSTEIRVLDIDCYGGIYYDPLIDTLYFKNNSGDIKQITSGTRHVDSKSQGCQWIKDKQYSKGTIVFDELNSEFYYCQTKSFISKINPSQDQINWKSMLPEVFMFKDIWSPIVRYNRFSVVEFNKEFYFAINSICSDKTPNVDISNWKSFFCKDAPISKDILIKERPSEKEYETDTDNNLNDVLEKIASVTKYNLIIAGYSEEFDVSKETDSSLIKDHTEKIINLQKQLDLSHITSINDKFYGMIFNQ